MAKCQGDDLINWFFFSVVPSSTPRLRCVNSQLVCLRPVGISSIFCLLEIFVSLSCILFSVQRLVISAI